MRRPISAGSISNLLNLGPVTERHLRDVGIASPDALRRLGAVAAYRRMKHRFPREITLNCLYALEGALRDRRWNRLPTDLKQRLKGAAEHGVRETRSRRKRRSSRAGGRRMTAFAAIHRSALQRVGGKAALADRLPEPKSAAGLAGVGDDRYLSTMSLRIFRAGLKHSLVDARWPAFEDAFRGFDPRRVAAMSDEQVEALMGDTRLIRHWGKIKSVRQNAAAMLATSAAAGGFGRWLAEWPGANVVGLWDELARRFAQLGGNSGAQFLRMAGKDTFILTESVVAALNRWGAFEGKPKTKKDRARVQAQFNGWTDESGLPLCHLSMILALSTG